MPVAEFMVGKSAITGTPVIGLVLFNKSPQSDPRLYTLEVYTSLSSLGFTSFQKTHTQETDSIEEARTRFGDYIKGEQHGEENG